MKSEIVNRDDELGPVPFRSGRFYSVGNQWYFAVRDMADQGPFHGRANAEKALKDFLQDVKQFSATPKVQIG